jgi:uncharacterized membrane protein YwzB
MTASLGELTCSQLVNKLFIHLYVHVSFVTISRCHWGLHSFHFTSHFIYKSIKSRKKECSQMMC